MLSEAQVVAARNAFADLYQDKANIYEWQKVVHPDHSITFEEVLVVENEPCRIDFDSEPVGTDEKGVVVAPQTITLFTRPDLVIKAGTKIAVTFKDIVSQQMVTKNYTKSGEPAVYNTHQEIALTLFDKYA